MGINPKPATVPTTITMIGVILVQTPPRSQREDARKDRHKPCAKVTVIANQVGNKLVHNNGVLIRSK